MFRYCYSPHLDSWWRKLSNVMRMIVMSLSEPHTDVCMNMYIRVRAATIYQLIDISYRDISCFRAYQFENLSEKASSLVCLLC